MVFGRRKRATAAEEPELDGGPEGFVDDLDEEDRALEDAELLRELAAREAEEELAGTLSPQGPWDLADAPELLEGAQRLDLGALRVTVPPGVDVRLDMSESGEVAAVSFVRGESIGQALVFAAPRRSGIWAEVRAEIAESLAQGPGSGVETEGPLGTELRAQVPAEVPGQPTVLVPARFLGVDGPRWFARLLLTGPAATDDAAAAPIIEAFKASVVVRGDEAMPAREPLPLTLPQEAREQVAAAQEQHAQEQQGLQMPERGPEITEIR